MMNEMICMMNNEVEDYDACDASSTKLRLRKLKALMDSSCYVYHLMEEEMKTIKCIERFDISKMNRLCPDVERHILGFIGSPCRTIKGYAGYLWDKRCNEYAPSKISWSLNMKKVYIIKNVILPMIENYFAEHSRTFIKSILRKTTKSIDKIMTPPTMITNEFQEMGTYQQYLITRTKYEYGEYTWVKRNGDTLVDTGNDYKRLEWLNKKWKKNPKKIERLATAEVKRLKGIYK